MIKERFSIAKLLDFSPLGFYKLFGLAIKGVFIILLILGIIWIKNLLFPAAPTNVNKPEITAEAGSSVEYNVFQGRKERAWWMPSPFVELYGFAEESADRVRKGLGAKGGVRWEF